MTRFNNRDFFEGNDFLFYIAPYRIDSNEVVEPHSHEFFEFVYIAEGFGKHMYQGQSYTISEGDVFVIEPGKEHGYRVDENTYLLVYNVLFQPIVFKKEIEALSQIHSFVNFFYVEPFLRETMDFECRLTLNLNERMEMIFLLNRLVKDYQEKGLGYRLLIKTRMLEMFIFLSRCYNERVRYPMREYAVEESELFRQIGEFIERHYNRPLSLEQVSRFCGISQSAFTTKFKQHFGRSFVTYRNELRIRVAKGLLAETEEKILAISQKVGFQDLSFFHKVFKQSVGMSPGKYREKVKK